MACKSKKNYYIKIYYNVLSTNMIKNDKLTSIYKQFTEINKYPEYKYKRMRDNITKERCNIKKNNIVYTIINDIYKFLKNTNIKCNICKKYRKNKINNICRNCHRCAYCKKYKRNTFIHIF